VRDLFIVELNRTFDLSMPLHVESSAGSKSKNWGRTFNQR
jgi:hypothetical protein